MMVSARLLALFSLIFMLVACAGVEVSSETGVGHSAAPSWVHQPDVEGYQVGVGSASKSQPDAERVAYIRAQAELSRQAGLFIRSVCESRITLSQEESSERFECQSSQRAQRVMRQSDLLDQWEDEKDVFILLGVADEAIIEAL